MESSLSGVWIEGCDPASCVVFGTGVLGSIFADVEGFSVEGYPAVNAMGRAAAMVLGNADPASRTQGSSPWAHNL